MNTGQIRPRASPLERIAKYNQLLRIEAELGDTAYAGWDAISTIMPLVDFAMLPGKKRTALKPFFSISPQMQSKTVASKIMIRESSTACPSRHILGAPADWIMVAWHLPIRYGCPIQCTNFAADLRTI